MLIKLLKHDLIAIGKKLIPLYGFTLFLSIFTRLFSTLGDHYTLFGYISLFTNIFAIILILVSFILTFVVCIVRFYNNLFKGEGYLTNVLPVTKNDLINSKIISTIIYFILSIIVIIVSLLIMYYNQELITSIKYFVDEIKEFIIPFVLLLSLGYLEYYFFITAAYSLGQLRNGSKINNAILCGFLLYIANQIILLIIIFIFIAIFPDVEILLEANDSGTINKLLWIVSFVLIIINLIYYMITIKSLNKRMDIE